MQEITILKEVIIDKIFVASIKSCLSFEYLKRKVKKILKKRKIKLVINEEKLRQALQELCDAGKIEEEDADTPEGVKYCRGPIILIAPALGKAVNSAKMGIAVELLRSPAHRVSLMQLKKNVESNERILTIALQELYNEWGIRKVETSEGEYCLLPKYNIKSAMTGYELYNFINKAKEDLTAKKLAEKVDLNPSYIFKICRRLEKGGYITTADPEEQQRFFAPLTGEIVHKGNYNRVKELNQELGGIVSKFSLKDPKLKQALQSSLENMLEREDLAKFSKSIETFKEDLLKKVSQVETKSEVREILGFRPFPQFVTTWKKPSE